LLHYPIPSVGYIRTFSDASGLIFRAGGFKVEKMQARRRGEVFKNAS
jgi:hypothetical protein